MSVIFVTNNLFKVSALRLSESLAFAASHIGGALPSFGKSSTFATPHVSGTLASVFIDTLPVLLGEEEL